MSVFGALLLLLVWMGADFWETKPAAEWTVEEVRSILESSPWSRTLKNGPRMHFATAAPMRDAEARERLFQRRTGAMDASFAEYQAMLGEGAYVAIAIDAPDREPFADGEMVSRMQKDVEMRVGKKRYPLVTHFPPSSSDPYLRLIFKRPTAADVAQAKSIGLTLMIPGATDPYRQVEFPLKNLMYRGKPEY